MLFMELICLSTLLFLEVFNDRLALAMRLHLDRLGDIHYVVVEMSIRIGLATHIGHSSSDDV